MSATIAYSAGGSAFQRSFPGVGEPVGSPMAVYYDPLDPANATIREPGSFVKGEIVSAIAACLFGGTGLLMCVLAWQGRRRARAAPARDLRIMLALVSVGVVGGFGVRLVSTGVHGLAIVESALVLSGTAMALVGAFRAPDEHRARQIVRSRMLIGGLVLVVGGLALQVLR